MRAREYKMPSFTRKQLKIFLLLFLAKELKTIELKAR
jgi:hypothetical protein